MISAIVLAGGAGSRFGTPKQFLELAPGRRLVDVAVDVAADVAGEVVLVLPGGLSWDGRPVDEVVKAGRKRIDSVRNALAHVGEAAEVVLILDAAHPLVAPELARSVVMAVQRGADAAVPLLPATDVVKRLRADGTVQTVGRDDLGLAQVPHAFARHALLAAHADGDSDAWEDSELVERAGGRVVTVPGDPRNVHVVTEADLKLARALFGLRCAGD